MFWFTIFAKLKEFADILTQLFSTSSLNLSYVWNDRVKTRMKATRGTRWQCNYFNVNLALLNLATLKSILNDFRSKKGARILLDYLKDDELMGYCVWTSLSGRFLQYKYKDLTEKQTKSNLLKQLQSLRSFRRVFIKIHSTE